MILYGKLHTGDQEEQFTRETKQWCVSVASCESRAASMVFLIKSVCRLNDMNLKSNLHSTRFDPYEHFSKQVEKSHILNSSVKTQLYRIF